MPVLSELKSHLNYKTPYSPHSDDAELSGMLAAATAHVEKLVGPLSPVSRTETVRSTGAPYYALSRVPVVSITSATYAGSAVAVTLEDARYGLISDAPAGTVITYTYGWQGESATQRLAILITAAHLWETQRGTAPTALQDADGQPQFAPGVGRLIPPRAMQLLEPDMTPGVVA